MSEHSMSNCGNSRDIDFIVIILKSVIHANIYIYMYIYTESSIHGK